MDTPTDDELRERYRTRSDNELVALAAQGQGSFSERAWTILEAELNARGIGAERYAAKATEAESKLVGIGGWLVVFGLGLAVGCARLVSAVMESFAAFGAERWAALTVPGSPYYLILESAVNISLLVGLGVVV
jgi:hypothetical protein